MHPPLIPDRFNDAFNGREDRDDTRKDDSVISALTRDSNDPLDDARLRSRSISEAAIAQRRISFAVGKEKVQSVWERLWKRRRMQHTPRPASTNAAATASAAAQSNRPERKSAKLRRFRSIDIRLIRGKNQL